MEGWRSRRSGIGDSYPCNEGSSRQRVSIVAGGLGESLGRRILETLLPSHGRGLFALRLRSRVLAKPL
jgi:hypothetical protein